MSTLNWGDLVKDAQNIPVVTNWKASVQVTHH